LNFLMEGFHKSNRLLTVKQITPSQEQTFKIGYNSLLDGRSGKLSWVCVTPLLDFDTAALKREDIWKFQGNRLGELRMRLV